VTINSNRKPFLHQSSAPGNTFCHYLQIVPLLIIRIVLESHCFNCLTLSYFTVYGVQCNSCLKHLNSAYVGTKLNIFTYLMSCPQNVPKFIRRRLVFLCVWELPRCYIRLSNAFNCFFVLPI